MAATELIQQTTNVPSEGDILLGKYRVEKLLGAGGMGVVVAAQHVQLDEHVAIKFLLPEALGNPESIARFTREARAAVKIKSEHVARVTDVGTLPEGTPYMVMEYLEGRDLSAELREKGRLSIEETVLYVAQAAEAVAEAHTLGIIHRDLKPANLFLTRRPDGTPSVKVLDFGISKITPKDGATTGAAMTRTTAIMGSPLYMSPEQMASSRNVDLRTDIYAVGVILHELLTGGPVFTADTMPQLCAKILQEPPPPLRTLRPDAPEELEALIQRCLHKDPSQRFADMAELVWALVPFGGAPVQASAERIARMISSSPMGTTGDRSSVILKANEAAAAATNSTWAGTKPPDKKSRAPLFVGIAAVLVLAVGGVLGLRALHRGSANAAAQPDPAAEAAAKRAAEEQKKADALTREAAEAKKKAEALSKQIEEERKAAKADHAKLDELTKAQQAQQAEADKKTQQAKTAQAHATLAKTAVKAETPAPTAAPRPTVKPKPAPGGGDLFGDRK